jgi:uncharacterized membrane protein YcaP (DUF421 family)
MNAFDFVVTIALGSVLASVILNQNIPLADGVIAFLLLIGFQLLLTWLSVRVKTVKTLITSKPSLIFYKGNFLHEAMKKERITIEELYSAAHRKGISTIDGIDMIIFASRSHISPSQHPALFPINSKKSSPLLNHPHVLWLLNMYFIRSV